MGDIDIMNDNELREKKFWLFYKKYNYVKVIWYWNIKVRIYM